MKKLLSLALLMAPLSTLANDEAFSLTFGGWSHHLATDYEFNEFHEAYIVEYDDLVVGTLVNSYSRRAYVAGYDFNFDYSDFRFGAIVGGITGYRESDTGIKPVAGVTPMVYPYVEYTRYDIRPVVGVLGKAITFQIKIQY